MACNPPLKHGSVCCLVEWLRNLPRLQLSKYTCIMILMGGSTDLAVTILHVNF